MIYEDFDSQKRITVYLHLKQLSIRNVFRIHSSFKNKIRVTTSR